MVYVHISVAPIFESKWMGMWYIVAILLLYQQVGISRYNYAMTVIPTVM